MNKSVNFEFAEAFNVQDVREIMHLLYEKNFVVFTIFQHKYSVYFDFITDKIVVYLYAPFRTKIFIASLEGDTFKTIDNSSHV